MTPALQYHFFCLLFLPYLTNSFFSSENVRQELESEIHGLTREKVRCIKDKRAWASYTDKYFKKGDI